MVNALGFLALSLNLTSMAMKEMMYLRILSLIANALYIVYGILIQSPPIVTGSLIAVVIHAISIYKMKKRSAITPLKKATLLNNENDRRTKTRECHA